MPAGDGQAAARRVYCDYAATAPFDERLNAVLERSSWANAASLHSEGRRARLQLEEARTRTARALRAHAPSEIVFTSGGTESDNMAIAGLAAKAPGARDTHIVVSAIEHHAVLHCADALKARGFKVTRVQPDSQGVVRADALDACLSRIRQTGCAVALVCVQAVNNELGSIQPVRELAAVAHEHGALFMCDAVQALGKVEIGLEDSGVDAAAFSGHKVGAPKGVGALYLRRGVRCKALLHGGGQEAGLRSGTSNVPGAAAFACAVEYAVAEREDTWERLSALRSRLIDGIARTECAHTLRCTLPEDAPCVPHVLGLIADNLEGETLVLRLDEAGIAASAASACSTGSLEPSHVLTAIGVPRDAAYGSLRLSFGAATTQGDIDAVLAALPNVLR